ncbi:MAG: LPXTG cell wall anchor domain-containing protein [Clostridium sp.]|nr:LPXTG cell wall anchor domain-containing protein [Clostridium sp.]
MKDVIFTIGALVVGLMILGGGLFYFIKEKKDKESRKIYLITTLIGAVIVIGVVIKMVLF